MEPPVTLEVTSLEYKTSAFPLELRRHIGDHDRTRTCIFIQLPFSDFVGPGVTQPWRFAAREIGGSGTESTLHSTKARGYNPPNFPIFYRPMERDLGFEPTDDRGS